MEIKAKKYFGQNFISDESLINKIINTLGEDTNQLIIEIGPGTGALTKKLVDKFEKVVAIEIDEDMKKILESKINKSNFKLVLADILDFDLRKLIESERKNLNQKISIISNTPYYITSEILFKTFKLSDLLSKGIFMLQKEVAIRICANKGENNYNNLSIASKFYADRKYEFTVNKNMFKPIPKVDSAVISLTFINKYKNQVKDDQEFIAFVRKLFNNKRKTILNNLTNLTKVKSKSSELLKKSNIEEQLRPEVIGLEDFIKLFNNYKNM